MNKLSEITGLSIEVIWIILGLIAVSIIITLVKKVIGIAVSIVAILVVIYMIFGITPSQSVEEVSKVASQFSTKVEKGEVLAALDTFAKKADEKGRTVFENENYKISFDESGKQVIQDLKNKAILTLDEFKAKLTPEELNKMNEFLQQ